MSTTWYELNVWLPLGIAAGATAVASLYTRLIAPRQPVPKSLPTPGEASRPAIDAGTPRGG